MRTDKDRRRDEGLSFEQRLWKGAETWIYAAKPLVLYLTLPAVLMCAGMVLFGRRTADEVVADSGRFYYTLGILLTLYLLHRSSKKRGVSLAEEVTLEYRGLDWRRMALLALAGLGFAVAVSALLTVVPFPSVLRQDYLNSSDGLDGGTDQILGLISTMVLAPVAEEIIFRGYLLNRLLGWFGERECLWMTAAVFALCHVSLIWMVYALGMGFMLAWVSVREDNIAYSIALHVGFNGSVLPVWLINRSEAASVVLFGNHWQVALYGAAACGLAVWAMKKYVGCGEQAG